MACRGRGAFEKSILPKLPRSVIGESAAQPIFLVESDAEVAAMVEFALTSAGHSVVTYNSGPDALDKLIALSRDGRRRLVILAIDLAGLDGHTLHEQLALACPKSFVVAFLSARGSDADQIRAFAAGAIDYVVKPVSLHVLIAKVAVWLNFCADRG
jgi:DNA-binding response OmpR family regulator